METFDIRADDYFVLSFVVLISVEGSHSFSLSAIGAIMIRDRFLVFVIPRIVQIIIDELNFSLDKMVNRDLFCENSLLAKIIIALFG